MSKRMAGQIAGPLDTAREVLDLRFASLGRILWERIAFQATM